MTRHCARDSFDFFTKTEHPDSSVTPFQSLVKTTATADPAIPQISPVRKLAVRDVSSCRNVYGAHRIPHKSERA